MSHTLCRSLSREVSDGLRGVASGHGRGPHLVADRRLDHPRRVRDAGNELELGVPVGVASLCSGGTICALMIPLVRCGEKADDGTIAGPSQMPCSALTSMNLFSILDSLEPSWSEPGFRSAQDTTKLRKPEPWGVTMLQTIRCPWGHSGSHVRYGATCLTGCVQVCLLASASSPWHLEGSMSEQNRPCVRDNKW